MLVILLVVALARPERVASSSRVSAVALFDVSESITDADLDASARLLSELRAAQGSHGLAAYTFASQSRAAAAVKRHEGAAGAATDLERAVQLAYSALEPGTLQRLLIVSDGRETRGELLREAARARRLGVPRLVP